MPHFVLASASPARLETLRRAGLDPEVIVSDVDESSVASSSPAELVKTLATVKARVVASRLDGDVLVLGCDSMLEFDGEVYGKPGNAEAAAQRWRRMRGKTGVLHTGHCLIRPGVFETSRTVSTTVHFAAVSEEEIVAYAGTGEPSEVAGAFTLDGLGGWFVTKVEGDPHNVVGVSLPVLRDMLREQRLTVMDLGYPVANPGG
jgi:septum formation protein